MSKKFRSILINVLKVVLAVTLIFWIYKKGGLKLQSFEALLSPMVLTLLLAISFLQMFINNVRWLWLLRAQGFSATSGRTMVLTLIGQFFNFAMPGGVGGDVIKGYYLVQDFPHKKLHAAMSIFMDRMIGFFAMVGMAVVAMLLNIPAVMEKRELQMLGLAVSLLFIGFTVFFAVALSRRLKRTAPLEKFFLAIPGGHFLRSIYDCVHSYRNNLRNLISAFALSVVSQIFMVIFIYIVGQCLGFKDLPIVSYFFLVPIGIVILAIPISPAGIGFGQAAFLVLFNIYMGRETQLGPTAVTAMQATQLLWGVFGAYFYVRHKRPEAMHAAV